MCSLTRATIVLLVLMGCGGTRPAAPPTGQPGAPPIVAPTTTAALPAAPAPAAGLRCDASSHDVDMLANVVVDELLALRNTVGPLAELDRQRDVTLKPVEASEFWSGRVHHSRGSYRDDASHCSDRIFANRLCHPTRVYEPRSFTMVVRVYVNPNIHLRSQAMTNPRQIGPLFVDANVAGSPDDDTNQVREAVTAAIDSVERRYRSACGRDVGPASR